MSGGGAFTPPVVATAPILNEIPALDEYGQLVRIIGPVAIIGPIAIIGTVTIQQPSSSVVTKIARVAASVVLAAADLTRMGLAIYNDSNTDLFVRVAAGPATTDNWTVKLQRNDYCELPFPAYTGEVTGIWATVGAGQARVTAFTEP